MIKGITLSAKCALQKLFKKESMKNPAIALIKGTIKESGEIIQGIGIYKNEDLQEDEFIKVDGIKIIIDSEIKDEIKNKYLDLNKYGEYCLIDNKSKL